MFPWSNVPTLCKENGSPWSPGFGSVVDAEPARKSGVTTIRGSGRLRNLLPPEIALKYWMIGHGGAQAGVPTFEDSRSPGDVVRPRWLSVRGEAFDELVRIPPDDPIFGDPHKDEAIGRGIGFGAIVGVSVDVSVACTFVVASEVDEANQPELRKLPVGAGPGLGVIARPSQLRLSSALICVSHPSGTEERVTEMFSSRLPLLETMMSTLSSSPLGMITPGNSAATDILLSGKSFSGSADN